MPNHHSRKMGFLEKLGSLNNDRMQGTTNCNAILKINGTIDFSLFKQAWEILFQRQPMLRATQRIVGSDLFFDFNAEFNNISIKHIKTDDFKIVEQEYNCDIVKLYDLNNYYWQSTLVSMTNNNSSVIILGISHAISDGLSISWLLGDLLRIIIELNAGKKPDISSLPVAEPMDILLDRERFNNPQPALTPEPIIEAVSFHHPTTAANSRSENLFRLLEPEVQKKFLIHCRQNQTTVSSMLCAALALSLYTLGYGKNPYLNLAIAFNLRDYFTHKIPDRLLGFYAHMSSFNLDILTNEDIWSLSRRIKLKIQKVLREYVYPVDDPEIFEGIYQDWEKSIASQKFYSTYCISNLGVVDEAFKGIDPHYIIESFYCAVSDKMAIFPILLVAIGIHNKLCLDFNFCTPAFDKDAMEAIADRVVGYLI